VAPQHLDAPEDLPKETPGQVTFGQLKHEVPRMSNEASAGLEQALLEARQRPVLDGDRQDQPTHQIAQVVGNDPEQQADLMPHAHHVLIPVRCLTCETDHDLVIWTTDRQRFISEAGPEAFQVNDPQVTAVMEHLPNPELHWLQFLFFTPGEVPFLLSEPGRRVLAL
jgi:hypothetical protein